ncbi:MAG: IS3 family transposase [Xanthobacteraceae bacterium]|nr:IS3 family transposase [Xanthobacteraceae bacterium]
MKASFLASDRTYGARRVWRDLLADGVAFGLHRIERLMLLQALRAGPGRRRLPKDEGGRQVATMPANLLDRQFEAERPNQKWIADFTYIWTAEGWLYVTAVIDLFSRRVVGWSMSASMTAQLVADALLMAVWRRGKPQQNALVESFNGRLRDESLNEASFLSLDNARELLAEWQDGYNTVHPRSGISNQPPCTYARLTASAMQQDGTLRCVESSAPRPVASPSRTGSNEKRIQPIAG